MHFEEYKKREFCNDIKCPVQMELNKHAEGSAEYNAIKGICASACLQSSANFGKWLHKHGFEMVKKAGEDPFLYARHLNAVATKEGTAWLFHRAINSEGFIVVKKVKE